MKFNYQISGINSSEVQSILALKDDELLERGIRKIVVDEKPGYPCRLSLEDAGIGEEVLLFPYEHHNVKSPYQASGPVFIRKNTKQASLPKNEIPTMLLHRLLSLRVYDEGAMMIDAHTIKGDTLETIIQDVFANENAKYIQIHNAGPGCYNCQVDRVS